MGKRNIKRNIHNMFSSDWVSFLIVLQGLARKYSPSENSIEVNFELTSNWGHKNLIGLTEIQFYDMDRQVIPVRKEEVTVHGAGQQQGPIDVLFNGKTKVKSHV